MQTGNAIIPAEWIKGADVSEAKAAEDRGVVFKDTDGQSKPALKILKDHGYNWVRLRLMVDPDGNHGLYQNLAYVKAMALEAKQRGLKILLNFHYSHYWADPATQRIPPKWQGQDIKALSTSVYNHSKEAITHLTNQGTPPDMVQIGNEINHGLLWEVGRDSPMANVAQLVNAGIRGVKDASAGKPQPVIMVHIAKEGFPIKTLRWYQSFVNAGGSFDVIGLSYYPMWHGDFENLANTIASLQTAFPGKKIYLVEASYYWSPNQAGFKNLPYPETPQGQYDYLKALSKLAKGAGVGGIFYWGTFWSQSKKWLIAPDWGNDDASRRSLFDDNARATVGIDGLE